MDRRYLRMGSVISISVAAALLAGCHRQPPHVLNGTVSVNYGDGFWIMETIFGLCEQSGLEAPEVRERVHDGTLQAGCPEVDNGFRDIREGTDVEVTDGNGTTIAVGHLGVGRLCLHSSKGGFDGCTFDFALRVPDRPFYKVRVGHRGEVSFSRTDLEQKAWRVELQLGS